MKSLILVSAFAVALCANADSYIYWMLPDSPTAEAGLFSDSDTYSAKIVAIDKAGTTGGAWEYGAGDYLTLYYSNGGLGAEVPDSTVVSGVKFGDGADNVPYFAKLLSDTTYASWTYFVEIYNGGNIVARSDEVSITQQSIVNMSQITDVPGGKMLIPMTFRPASVPEPNSALLMMLGCAVLALRRRKQVVA